MKRFCHIIICFFPCVFNYFWDWEYCLLCYTLYQGHHYYRGPLDQDSTASCKQTWNIMVHIAVLAIQDYSNQEDDTTSDDVMSTLG